MSKMIKCKYERNDPKFNHARIYIMPEPKPLAESILLIDGDSFLIPIDLYSGEVYLFSEYVYSQIKHIEGLMIMEKEHCKNCECAPQKTNKIPRFEIGGYLNDTMHYLYKIAIFKSEYVHGFTWHNLPSDWWELPEHDNDIDYFKPNIEYRIAALDLPSTTILYEESGQNKYYISWNKEDKKLSAFMGFHENNKITNEVTNKSIWLLVSYMYFQCIKETK